MSPEEVSAWVNKALDQAIAPQSHGWYLADTPDGTKRWIIHGLETRFEHIEAQRARRSPMPEGCFYAITMLPEMKSLCFTHSNRSDGPIPWSELSLTTTALVNLELLSLGHRMGRTGCLLADVLRGLIEKYPPNIHSLT